MPLDILPDKMDDTCMLYHLYNQYQPIIQKTFIREKAKKHDVDRCKTIIFPCVRNGKILHATNCYFGTRIGIYR